MQFSQQQQALVSSLGIPSALDTDAEDVVWALQTADALWKRSEKRDALVWLRRAAQAAGDAAHDERAVALARDAAAITEWLARGSQTDLQNDPQTDLQTSGISPVAEPHVESLEPTFEPTSDILRAPSVRAKAPSAAEVHAGMLDPWSEGARPQFPTLTELTEAPTATVPREVEVTLVDREEVVTSAPPLARAPSATQIHEIAKMSPPTATPTKPSKGPPPLPPHARSSAPPKLPVPAPLQVEAFVSDTTAGILGDLPDDVRVELLQSATVLPLACNEQVSDFALAWVLQGECDIASIGHNAIADRAMEKTFVRNRGSLPVSFPVRLIAASDETVLALWDEGTLARVLHSCPWVQDDLLTNVGDKTQAYVGAALGALGQKLDLDLRLEILSRLELRPVTENECFIERGVVSGMNLVGAGAVDVVGADGAILSIARPGDFLFAREVLGAEPAPASARIGKGGAIMLVADRAVAQELVVTFAPLIELFASS